MCREAGLRAVPVAVEGPARLLELLVLGIPGLEAYPEVTIFGLSVDCFAVSPQLHDVVEVVTGRVFHVEQDVFYAVEVLEEEKCSFQMCADTVRTDPQ